MMPRASNEWLTREGGAVACGYFWRLLPGLGRRSITTLTTLAM